MAKQQVSMIERHLEKVVLGVCAVVLLAVVYLYGIGSPNTVDVQGQPAGPEKLYDEIGDTAQQALSRLRSGSEYENKPLPQVDRVRDTDVPKELPEFAFGPPGPEVPWLPAGGPGGRGDLGRPVKLAAVLAPSEPEVTTGRAAATLPPMQIVGLGETGSSAGTNTPEGFIDIPEDTYWVTLASVVFREAQIEANKEANYGDDRAAPIVAAVDLERQELRSDGSWSEPTAVQPYAPVVVRGPTRIRLVKTEGVLVVLEEDRELIEDYRSRFASFDGQSEVLRPPFQELLETDAVTKWTVPKKLTGENYEVDMTDELWGPLEFPVETDRFASGPGDEAARREAEREARDTFDKLEKAVDAKKWDDVHELMDELQSSGGMTERMRSTLDDIERNHSIELARAAQRKQLEESRREQKLEDQYGPDYDPLWATDTTVAPGKTYRYRVRLEVVNRFAGIAGRLVNPSDAEKMILFGEWSDWSTPITVERSAYLLATGSVKPEDRSASVWLYKWALGGWSQDRLRDVKIGDALKLADRGDNTQLVLADVSNDRSWASPGRNGGLDTSTVNVLTVVTEDGEAVEHFEPVDKQRQSELRKKIQEEMERQNPVDRAPRQDRSSRDRDRRPRDHGGTGRPDRSRSASGGS